jgi:hypothetical protein
MSRCSKDFGRALGLTLRILGHHHQACHVGTGGHDIGLGLHHRCMEQRRLDLGDAFALLHPGIEFRVELEDAAGNLAADIDRDHGLQTARGADAAKRRWFFLPARS